MSRRVSGFALIDLGALVAIIMLLIGLLVYILPQPRRDGPLTWCKHNLLQVGRAQQSYMNLFGDFWAFQEDKRNVLVAGQLYPLNAMTADKFWNPCVSLSILYPRWIDDIWAYKCPSTSDAPVVIKEVLAGKQSVAGVVGARYGSAVYSWFGKMDDRTIGNGVVGSTLTGYYPQIEAAVLDANFQLFHRNNKVGVPRRMDGWHISGTSLESVDRDLCSDYATALETDPAVRQGILRANTSYGYDDRAHYREMVPGSARAGDMRYEASNGAARGAFPQWTEFANHKEGQNVLYWDGHVAFSEGVYASSDPADNIYKADIGSPAGGSTDAVLARTHGDPLKPSAAPGAANVPWTRW